jgi:hypothetical protein
MTQNQNYSTINEENASKLQIFETFSMVLTLKPKGYLAFVEGAAGSLQNLNMNILNL